MRHIQAVLCLTLLLISSLATAAAPNISTQVIPAGGVGVAYSDTLAETAGAAPFTWTITAGALPDGLTLSSAGVLSGTPTTAGSYSFTIQVADGAGATGSAAFTQIIEDAPPSGVPAAFASLYVDVQGALQGMRQTLATQWNGSKPAVNFGGEMLLAGGNRGLAILNSRNGYLKELDAFAAVGCTTVTLDLGFPLLYQPFYTYNGDPQDYQNMVNFVQQLITDIRARNMKVLAKTQCLLSGGPANGVSGFNLTGYYASLTLPQYMAARAQHAVTVAQIVKPDFMTIGYEPDTEQNNTGQMVNDPTTWTTFMNQILAQLKSSGVTGFPIGAGVQSYLFNCEAYDQNLATMTALDFIDCHIYSVNNNFFEEAIKLASIAAANGKKFAMSEAFLHKKFLEENITQTDLRARNVFSFWAPLDQEFLTSLVKLSYLTKSQFCSVFYTDSFYAYQDYDTDQAMSPVPVGDQLLLLNASAAQANYGVSTTSTGAWYARVINPPALTVSAPAAPAGDTGVLYSYSVSAAGGVPPYTFSVNGGSLPPGLSFDSAGVLTGMPTAAGSYFFSAQATDDLLYTDAAAVTLTVTAPKGGGGGESTGIKCMVKFDFASHINILTMSGTIPVPEGATVANETVMLNIGGAMRTYTLNAKGQTDRTFALLPKIKNGKFAAPTSKFDVALKSKELFHTLEPNGFTDANINKPGITVDVPLTITLNNVVFSTTLKFNYIAKAGKAGMGVVK